MQLQKTFVMGACIAVVVFAAGCGTELGFIRTATPPAGMQARGGAQVEVFMTARPTRPYTELGIIESQQEFASQDDEAAVIAKMRDYAGQLGCDGLVIFGGNDATVVSGSGSYTSSSTLKGYRGSCVVYTRQAEPPPSAAGAPAPPVATSPPATCLPNVTQLCYGAGGCRGGQRCNDDGKSFTKCDCGEHASAPSVVGP